MLPSYVSRRSCNAVNIGFHMHSSFPSSEIFRTFAHREEFLHGVFCCDMIGFNVDRSARNFIVTMKRVLDLDLQIHRGGLMGVSYCGRNILLVVKQIGINTSFIESLYVNDEYNLQLTLFTKKYVGYRVVLCIDLFQRNANITYKLKAIENSIARREPGKFKFIQVILLDSTYEASDLANYIREAGRVNSAFSYEVIEVITEKLAEMQLFALMSIASCLCITSITDRYNLLPLEYIALHKENYKWIILSEFTGTSLALSSFVRVNPLDLSQLTEAFIRCLKCKMPSARKLASRKRDLHFLASHSTENSTKFTLTELKRSHKLLSKFQYSTQGLGDSVKLVAFKSSFQRLSVSEIFKAYKNSSNRLFVFNDEGCLYDCSVLSQASHSDRPSRTTISFLQNLSKHPRNSILILSGKTRKSLENSFSFLPLAAEHGAFVKWEPGSSWQAQVPTEHPIRPIVIWKILEFVDKTEGANIVIKECSVVFSYKNADPDFGGWQACDLISELEVILSNCLEAFEISKEVGYIEVKPRNVHKGSTLLAFVEEVKKTKGPIDFLLVVGEDKSDEAMFSSAKTMKKQKNECLEDNCQVFTCTVGAKQSAAGHYVLSQNEIQQLLNILQGES